MMPSPVTNVNGELNFFESIYVVFKMFFEKTAIPMMRKYSNDLDIYMGHKPSLYYYIIPKPTLSAVENPLQFIFAMPAEEEELQADYYQPKCSVEYLSDFTKILLVKFPNMKGLYDKDENGCFKEYSKVFHIVEEVVASITTDLLFTDIVDFNHTFLQDSIIPFYLAYLIMRKADNSIVSMKPDTKVFWTDKFNRFVDGKVLTGSKVVKILDTLFKLSITPNIFTVPYIYNLIYN